jgi:cytochrome c peroxidase
MNPRSILLTAACAAISSGCVEPGPEPASTESSESLLASGRRLFETAPPQSNGRACATCHVMAEHTALSIANVEARFAADPQDPLFRPIDADDPGAAVPAFAHLRKGLVRVVLPLPANMDVIDLAGHVVTPADRKIAVWRGVPSIENTAATGPYQLDGRAAHLPAQAQAAITAHAQGPALAGAALEQIAAFERDQFSSSRARFVATLMGLGVPAAQIPIPERAMPLSAQERRGRDVYDLACAHCHGGPTTNQIVDRPLHDSLFFALRPNGNIIFDTGPGGPVPRLVPHAGEFLNIGIGLLSGYGQMGAIPMFNDSIELPRYRFRFYADGTRRQQVTDLPPIPVTASGNPGDLNPALDENGAPILGPSLGVQWFSTDPGRAAITGDPLDFEAFDVPQLRGVAHTAPYFHDNNSGTLREVVDLYSRFILPFAPALNLPPVNPPELPGFPPESLSAQQKLELLAFLDRL